MAMIMKNLAQDYIGFLLLIFMGKFSLQLSKCIWFGKTNKAIYSTGTKYCDRDRIFVVYLFFKSF